MDFQVAGEISRGLKQARYNIEAGEQALRRNRWGLYLLVRLYPACHCIAEGGRHSGDHTRHITTRRRQEYTLSTSHCCHTSGEGWQTCRPMALPSINVIIAGFYRH